MNFVTFKPQSSQSSTSSFASLVSVVIIHKPVSVLFSFLQLLTQYLPLRQLKTLSLTFQKVLKPLDKSFQSPNLQLLEGQSSYSVPCLLQWRGGSLALAFYLLKALVCDSLHPLYTLSTGSFPAEVFSILSQPFSPFLFLLSHLFFIAKYLKHDLSLSSLVARFSLTP